MLPKILLNQSLANLLSNAVKYHDPTDAHPWVTLRAEIVGEEIKITVDDNGLGIPLAARAKLFTLFQRFHPGCAFGSGLGLYLVKQCASAMGGRVPL